MEVDARGMNVRRSRKAEKARSELKASASPAIPAAEEPFWTGVSRPVGITPKPSLEAPTTTGPDVKSIQRPPKQDKA